MFCPRNFKRTGGVFIKIRFEYNLDYYDSFLPCVFLALELKLVRQFCEDENGALIYNQIRNGAITNRNMLYSIVSSSTHTRNQIGASTTKPRQTIVSRKNKVIAPVNPIQFGSVSVAKPPKINEQVNDLDNC